FQGEAEALAQLNHPNIVRLLKYGIHQERPYLVMEYVEGGRTLRDEIGLRAHRKKSFSRKELAHIIDQILNGLQAAHDGGIVHRDIKPENLMIQPVAGNPLYTRLLDFGTAKFVEQSGDTAWPMGSPNYMAPEQASLKNLGPWTDLYAVAIIAYELLSGRRPYPGKTDNDVLLKKIDKDYDPLVMVNHLNWPEETRTFFHKALHRSSKSRFQNTTEFREAFEGAIAALEGQPEAAHSSSPSLTDLLDSKDIIEIVSSVKDRSPVGPLEEALAEPPIDPPDEPQESGFLDDALKTSKYKQLARTKVQDTGNTLTAPAPKSRTALMALVAVVLVVAVTAAAFHFLPGPAEREAATIPEPVAAVEPPPPEPDAVAVEEEPAEVEEPVIDPELLAAATASLGHAITTATEALPQRRILQIALGKFHSCVLLRDGDVRCWGANADGELGLANKRSYGDSRKAGDAPLVKIGEPAIQLAAAGDRKASFTCALLESRNIRCWGSNHFGQLGYGHTNNIGDKVHPRDVGYVDVGGPVKQIAIGAMEFASHACALLETGDVRCWGNNRHGQLGYGHTQHIGSAQVPASMGVVNVGGPVKQIGAGKFHTCALLETGTVRCWGQNTHGQLGYGHTRNIGDTEIPSVAGDVDVGGDVTQISLGRAHTCALLDEGRVRCWGWNRDGQLGYGHTDDVGTTTSPSKAGDIDVGEPVKYISAGGLHTCALLHDGRVRCWGDNKFGQLGYGHRRSVGDEYAPWSMGDVHLGGRAVAIESSNYHTCAILEDDRLRCWGFNRAGQLGYGHTDQIGDRESPASAGDVPLW
ncbi:MAG: protein kinase domain-containing protein, partial [Bradymonadaceae bacterium]